MLKKYLWVLFDEKEYLNEKEIKLYQSSVYAIVEI